MRTVKRTLPTAARAMAALLRADAMVQSRQRASIAMSLLIPLFFLFAWRNLVSAMGPTNVLAACISVGLPSIGLMGYALVIARDRELGVFQRLRTTPSSTWMIMASRCTVQLSIMIVMVFVTVIVGRYVDDIHIGPAAALRLLFAVLISGPVFLSLGQLTVALFIGSEAVNSATRTIYIAILVAGILAQTLPRDNPWHSLVQWSPVGVSRAVIASALSWGRLGMHDLLPLLAALTYTVVFTAIGIHRFRWTTSR